MSARLAPGIEVAALMRWAEGAGGFAALLARGDPDAGAILILLRERGTIAGIHERVLGPDGYRWQHLQGVEPWNESAAASLVADRRRFDPDLWVVELDVAKAERFAAE